MNRISKLSLLLFLACLSCAVPVSAWVVLKPTGQDAMPLTTRSVSADVTVRGQFASTKLVMVFQNESEYQFEADFIYTLPKGAVATYFAYWAGDEKVVAKVVEKKQARAIYKHLAVFHRDPALVELTGKNTFHAKVFPVMPNADLKVEIHIAQPLPSDRNGALYTLPLADPRQRDPLDSVSVKVHIDPDETIKAITNNYGIGMNNDDTGYVINLWGKNYRPTKDLNIRLIHKDKPLIASLYSGRMDGQDGYFALALTPDHTIPNPKLTITGVKTYEITPTRLPKANARQSIVVLGRYKGSGDATVRLEGGGLKYGTKVRFSSEAATDNTAAKLWAATRLRELGRSVKNRTTVIAMSKLYGLPSRFTSWLAVPKAETQQLAREKQQLAREKAEPQLAELARKIIQSIDDGERDQELALRSQYAKLYEPLGENADEDMRWRISSHADAVAEQLVTEKYTAHPDKEKVASLKAQLERFAAAAGQPATEYTKYREPQKLREKAHALASEYADIVENGRGEDPVGLAKKKQLDDAVSAVDFESYNSPYSDIQRRAEQVARSLVDERHKPEPRAKEMADMEERLARLAKALAWTQEHYIKLAEQSWNANRVSALVDQLVDQAVQGGVKAKKKQARLKEIEELRSKSGANWTADAQQQANRRMGDLASDYMYAIHNKKSRKSAAEVLRQMRNLESLSTTSVKRAIDDQLASEKCNEMHLTAAQLNAELTRKGVNEKRMARLRKQFGSDYKRARALAPHLDLVEWAGDYDSNVDSAIALRAESAKLSEQIAAAQAAKSGSKVAELKRRHAEVAASLGKTWNHLTFAGRWGDPLISVEAPVDALRVVALLPDGEIKILEFNTDTQRWEARFDIPTYLPEGRYSVAVIVVLKDGTRRKITMEFNVDVTPPQGAGLARLASGRQHKLRLEMDAGDEVARTVALLPWGERIQLDRTTDGKGFLAVTDVPNDWQGRPAQVTFVLTDNAHNRTRISLEVSPE